jgi:CheY-like chemotaxis protein
LDAEQRDFTETVRSSGETLLSIINDILDFSKIESGQVDLEAHLFDVRECVESAVSLLALPAGQKGVELISYLEFGCPNQVIGDVTRFRQVIVNLLANAVKFTAEGEVVVIVDGEKFNGRTELRVSVRDTGIGIPAERIDSLFQAFSQVDSSTTRVYGGTGLGLVISKRLAQVMGGDLQVTSAVGVGSTFTFTAMLQDCPEPGNEPVDASLRALAGKSVLVVSDHAMQRGTLSNLLRGWGMVSTAVATSAESLGRLAPSTRQGADFDVVVLDMPLSAMDENHLAQVLRVLPALADLPVILLSALQWRPRPEHTAQFAAVLTKPVRSALLAEKLMAALAPAETVLASIDPRAGQHPIGGSEVPARSLRVLVAEDNEVNKLVARLILIKLGHSVDTVSDGLEAVRALRAARYDVVLMDMQMPGLDGPDATRQIRQQLSASAQPFIVALTASVLSEDRKACLDAGMDAFLAKPIRPEDIENVLSQVFPAAMAPIRP